MRREQSTVRPDFEEHAASIGFYYASLDGTPYWDESVRYHLTMDEVTALEDATETLVEMCLGLVDEIISNENILARLGVPSHAWSVIADSWKRRDPSLYGRFDFRHDGQSSPKLLEFNADTPTSLFETGVVQWLWLEALMENGGLPKGSDQFNSVHDKLVERWKTIAGSRLVHLACHLDSPEDLGTVQYLAECAKQAGASAKVIGMGDIGLLDGHFVDRSRLPISLAFKLYPWEWALNEPFGHSSALQRTQFIEPAWKMVLSNKGLLALLWQRYPDHPNLLECYFEDDPNVARLGNQYARKPIYSREGCDIDLVNGTTVLGGERDGYGKEGYVRQSLCPLPNYNKNYPVVGSWLVGNEAAGIGIREDTSLITSNVSRFVPHYILG